VAGTNPSMQPSTLLAATHHRRAHARSTYGCSPLTTATTATSCMKGPSWNTTGYTLSGGGGYLPRDPSAAHRRCRASNRAASHASLVLASDAAAGTSTGLPGAAPAAGTTPPAAAQRATASTATRHMHDHHMEQPPAKRRARARGAGRSPAAQRMAQQCTAAAAPRRLVEGDPGISWGQRRLKRAAQEGWETQPRKTYIRAPLRECEGGPRLPTRRPRCGHRPAAPVVRAITVRRRCRAGTSGGGTATPPPARSTLRGPASRQRGPSRRSHGWTRTRFRPGCPRSPLRAKA